MKIDRLKEVVKKELRFVLQERVGSKVLDHDELDDVLQRYVRKNFDFSDDYLEDRLGVQWELMNRDKIIVNVPPELRDLNWQKFFKRYGYYVGHKDKNRYSVQISLYPYETQRVKNPDGPLYHVTPKNKLLKIKRKGLSPRKSEKLYNVHDPRIYFIKDTDRRGSDPKTVADQLSSHVPNNPPFGNDMAVLEIDPMEVDGEFYKDPEVPEWGLFTRSNIPPSAITNWGKYRVELETLKKRE